MAQLKPRVPGLWMFQRSPTGAKMQDADLVGEARAHLLELLKDPYRWEAMQELIFERHPALKPRVGPKPARGIWASQMQWELEKKPRGRPASRRDLNLQRRKIAEAMILIGKAKSNRDAARQFAKAKNPNLTGRGLEAAVKRIEQSMSDAGKKSKNLKKPSN